MKKYCYLLLIFFIYSFFISCSKVEKEALIDEPQFAKIIDTRNFKPIEISDIFTQDSTAIYFTFKIYNIPNNTVITAVWNHIESNTKIYSQITTGGTGYESFILNRGNNPFPCGNYEIIVSAKINNCELNLSGKFTVVENTSAFHILNPIISRKIDENSITPIDITTNLSIYDKIVYFTIQSKDLPESSTINCIWYYLDSSDSLTNTVITSGSRNIAFSLSPDGEKQLPKGKYIVCAYVSINDKTESISKEFKIE